MPYVKDTSSGSRSILANDTSFLVQRKESLCVCVCDLSFKTLMTGELWQLTPHFEEAMDAMVY